MSSCGSPYSSRSLFDSSSFASFSSSEASSQESIRSIAPSSYYGDGACRNEEDKNLFSALRESVHATSLTPEPLIPTTHVPLKTIADGSPLQSPILTTSPQTGGKLYLQPLPPQIVSEERYRSSQPTDEATRLTAILPTWPRKFKEKVTHESERSKEKVRYRKERVKDGLQKRIDKAKHRASSAFGVDRG